MVSMGAFEKGPMAPDISPMTICWYEGKSFKSGWYVCANFLSSWYAVKFAPTSTLCISLVSMIGYIKLTLIGSLSQSSERNASVQGRETLFTDDRVDCMTCITVSRCLQWISEGVLLRL